MVVYALPPQPAMVEQRPLSGIDDWSLVQGAAGHLLQSQFEEVLKHWYEPAERTPQTNGGTDEDITYDPVPPKRIYTVRVKHRTVGQGQPLPYSLEE